MGLLDFGFVSLILLYMASLRFATRAPMLLLFRCLLSWRYVFGMFSLLTSWTFGYGKQIDPSFEFSSTLAGSLMSPRTTREERRIFEVGYFVIAIFNIWNCIQCHLFLHELQCGLVCLGHLHSASL